MDSATNRSFGPGLIFVGLIVSLISSLGAPLIPTIARDLHASLSTTQWSLTATMLVGAVTSPLIGRLGDGPRRKTVLLTCLGGVTVGGLLAALATHVGVLIAGRALQGMGLAVMPLTMAAAREHLPSTRSPSVIAQLSVSTAVGIGLGYPATGFVAEQAGASGAFWFGVVVSALAFVVAATAVPSSRREADADSLDLAGAMLVGAALLMLLLGLEKSADWGWGTTRTIGLLVAALLLLAVWVPFELTRAHPLVDLRLVRHRAVLTADVSGFALGVGMYLSMVLITQYVQAPRSSGYGFGESVFVAGLTLLPLSAASVIASSLVPAAQRWLGTRAIVPIGALVLSGACLFFALTGDRVYQAFVMLGLVGFGVGFTFAAMPQLIVGAVPPDETSSSMSLYQVSRYVGFSVGSGLSVTFLRAFGDEGRPTGHAFEMTFLVAVVITLATAGVAWLTTGAPIGRRASDRAEFEAGVVGAAGLPMLDEVIADSELQSAQAPGAAQRASGVGRRRRMLPSPSHPTSSESSGAHRSDERRAPRG